MSCLIMAFRCATEGCNNIICDHVSLQRKYCDECKQKRAVEQRAYHRYLVRVMKESMQEMKV